MAEQKIESLFFKQGGSDKVYIIHMVDEGKSQFSVYAEYGRRGAALTHDLKLACSTGDEADKVFDRVLREKLAKGYQRTGSPIPPMPATSAPGRDSPAMPWFTPELLTAIDLSEIGRFLVNDRYATQPKRDGRRLAVRKYSDGSAHGINKLGQVVLIDGVLKAALAKISLRTFLLDGEIEGDGLHLWDVLEIDGEDVSRLDYASRLAILSVRVESVDPLLHVIETACTTSGKRQMLRALQEAQAEGIVVKDLHATYAAGRAGQHMKLKFVTTASFIVGPKPPKVAVGKRSVALYLYDTAGKRLRFMGTVGVPGKYDLPADGAIVEARYLYCFRGFEGHVYQPKYFGVIREDVTAEECTTNQLKYKQEAVAA